MPDRLNLKLSKYGSLTQNTHLLELRKKTTLTAKAQTHHFPSAKWYGYGYSGIEINPQTQYLGIMKLLIWRTLYCRNYVGFYLFTCTMKTDYSEVYCFNPLNPELNPTCYLLALLGAHHFLHVSRIRVKFLTFRLLMSYIYRAPILDVSRSHTTTQHSR